MSWRQRVAQFRHADETVLVLRQRRARRQLTGRAVVAVLAGYSLLTAGSHAGEVEFIEVVLGCIAVPAALGGVSAGLRVIRLRHPREPHGGGEQVHCSGLAPSGRSARSLPIRVHHFRHSLCGLIDLFQLELLRREFRERGRECPGGRHS